MEAPVAAPVASVSARVPLPPAALFHPVRGTTPALSELAIAVPVPEKLMEMLTLVLVTSRLTVVVLVAEELAPLIVSGYWPGAAVPEAETLNATEPEPVTDAGVKPAVTPAGRPATPKLTGSLKPGMPFTVTVKLVLQPC